MVFVYKWNLFRYIADFSHLISSILLLFKMFKSKSCSGISFQTHLLYLIVFLTRYINQDIFRPPIYNILFKIFYIFSTLIILIIMKTIFKKTYRKKHDNFKIIWILIICTIITYFTTRNFEIDEILWTFSLWVESLAILPQLFLLQRTQRIDVMTHEYIFFLGIYRLFYVINWIYKSTTMTGKTPYVVWTTGIIQTLLYADFIYYYIKSIIQGTEFALPR